MSTDDASKLFVAGLPDSLTEDELRRAFETHGATVVDVSLPKDKATGKRRGFGFVTLSSPEQAAKAREVLDGSEQGGRSITVRPFASPSARRSDGRSHSPAPGGSEERTVYVGNLPFDLTSAAVEQVFSAHGISPVQRVHLPTSAEGKPRGFGFVTLGTVEAAQKAVETLGQVEVKGRRLQLSIARQRADRGPERRPGRSRDDVEEEPYVRDPPRSVDLSSVPPKLDGRRVRDKPEAKKRKREKGRRRTERDEFHRRERGGASSFRRWNRDGDDE